MCQKSRKTRSPRRMTTRYSGRTRLSTASAQSTCRARGWTPHRVAPRARGLARRPRSRNRPRGPWVRHTRAHRSAPWWPAGGRLARTVCRGGGGAVILLHDHGETLVPQAEPLSDEVLGGWLLGCVARQRPAWVSVAGRQRDAVSVLWRRRRVLPSPPGVGAGWRDRRWSGRHRIVRRPQGCCIRRCGPGKPGVPLASG